MEEYTVSGILQHCDFFFFFLQFPTDDFYLHRFPDKRRSGFGSFVADICNTHDILVAIKWFRSPRTNANKEEEDKINEFSVQAAHSDLIKLKSYFSAFNLPSTTAFKTVRGRDRAILVWQTCFPWLVTNLSLLSPWLVTCAETCSGREASVPRRVMGALRYSAWEANQQLGLQSLGNWWIIVLTRKICRLPTLSFQRLGSFNVIFFKSFLFF